LLTKATPRRISNDVTEAADTNKFNTGDRKQITIEDVGFEIWEYAACAC